jgi:DNA topoisomerase-2
MKVSEFYNKDYTQFASYDTQRKIASFIDGLKISQRKVLYTLLDTAGDSMSKVDALAAKTATHSLYIHGAVSLEGVAVNMAVSHTGTNNMPLLRKQGNFGSRLFPESSASRYIQAGIAPTAKKIFTKEDIDVTEQQWFEGYKIEPKNYFPRLPLILINGAEGIAVGFSQNILPRSPENIKKAIKLILKGVDPNDEKINELLIPYYSGFTGRIERSDKNSFTIYGTIERDTNTSLWVTEVPVGYSHASYQDKLEALYLKKVITDYKDLCDSKNDRFKFQIKCDRTLTKKSDDQILKQLNLVSSVSEVLSTLDESGKIVVFNTANDLLAKWIEVRKDFLKKRLESQIFELQKLKAFKIVYSAYVDFVQSHINEFIDMDTDQFIDMMRKNFTTFEEEVFQSVTRMQLSSIKKINTSNLPKEVESINNTINIYTQKLENLSDVLIEELV